MENPLENSGNLYKLNSNAFRHIGGKRRSAGDNKPRRSPFKRIR
jgi:hypothetical protein